MTGAAGLLLALAAAYAISELRWRDGLSRSGRILVPVVLALLAWSAWMAIGLVLGMPR